MVPVHCVPLFPDAVSSAVLTGEELAKGLWKACHFEKLPHWLKDNEHLHFGHRPELRSFAECFKSVFRIHTETGNIWTHLVRNQSDPNETLCNGY